METNSSLSTVFSNYITATPGMDVNMNTINVNLTNDKLTVNGNVIVYFYSNYFSFVSTILWCSYI